MSETMLKAPAVALQLGLSARAVYDLADSGMLACYRLGAGRAALPLEQVVMQRLRGCNER